MSENRSFSLRYMSPMIYLLRYTMRVILRKLIARSVGFGRVYDRDGRSVIFFVPTIWYIFFTLTTAFQEVYKNEKYTRKNYNNYFTSSKKFYFAERSRTRVSRSVHYNTAAAIGCNHGEEMYNIGESLGNNEYFVWAIKRIFVWVTAAWLKKPFTPNSRYFNDVTTARRLR